MTRWALLAAAALGAVACASPSEPPAEPEAATQADPSAEPEAAAPIALRFDWPDGLVLDVEYRRWSEPADETARTLRYRIEVSRRFRSKRIDVSAPRILEPVSPEGAARTLAPLVPSFVVGRDGQVDRLADADAHRAKMLALLGPDADPDAVPVWLEELMADEALLEGVRDRWSPLVGAWVGAEMQPDVRYQGDDEVVVPLFGGLAIPLATDYGLGPLGPCDAQPDGQGPRCVELTYRAHPDPARWETFLAEEVLPRLGQRAPGARVEDLRVEHEIRLVTEPEGLRPHALEVTRRVVARTQDEQGPHDLLALDDRRVWTFNEPAPEPESDPEE